MIKYTIYPMKFDLEQWAEVLKGIETSDVREFSEIIGVDYSTLKNWRSCAYRGVRFAHPSMGHFLNACNWLDLDPRQFFKLQEG